MWRHHVYIGLTRAVRYGKPRLQGQVGSIVYIDELLRGNLQKRERNSAASQRRRHEGGASERADSFAP